MLMDIAFHSEEAKKVNIEIFETIYHAAIERSYEISRERGEKMRILYDLYKQQTWRFIFDTPNCSNYICNDKKTERLLYTLNPIFNEITNLTDNY